MSKMSLTLFFNLNKKLDMKYKELYFDFDAKVAELADALDLGSSGATRRGSTPLFRTIFFIKTN